MNFTICTQSEEIINLENIISIAYMPAEIEDIYSGNPITVFVISARDITDNEFQLGIFRTEEEVVKVWNDIKAWLQKVGVLQFAVPVPKEQRT